jgi:predicted nucleotidyltransferase
MDVGEIIEQMTQRIVERFAPEKIILFGSAARGEMTPDSDVDLLIIMPFSGRPRDLRVKIRMVLADLPVAKDVIVLKPDEYEKTKHLPGSVAYPAEHEGVVLYAA